MTTIVLFGFVLKAEEGKRDDQEACGLGFFFQAEDGIRDLVRSRGLGDVYRRRSPRRASSPRASSPYGLLYTSDAADEPPRVDPGGRRFYT